MTKAIAKNKYWMFINTTFIMIYLCLASLSWAPAGNQVLPGQDAGSPIVWSLTALPVLALGALINVAWLIVLLIRLRTNRNLGPIFVWLVLVTAWLAANRYDVYRHYNGDDLKPAKSHAILE